MKYILYQVKCRWGVMLTVLDWARWELLFTSVPYKEIREKFRFILSFTWLRANYWDRRGGTSLSMPVDFVMLLEAQT